MKKNSLYLMSMFCGILSIMISLQLMTKLKSYQVKSGVCLDKKTMLLMIEEPLKSSMKKESYIYYHGNRIFYKIENDMLEGMLQLKLNRNICKDKIIDITIFERKKTILQILIESWEKK